MFGLVFQLAEVNKLIVAPYFYKVELLTSLRRLHLNRHLEALCVRATLANSCKCFLEVHALAWEK